MIYQSTSRSLAMTLILIFITTSCLMITSQAPSKKSGQFGGYAPGSEYELITDVFLIRPDSDITYEKETGKTHRGKSERKALVPPDSFSGSSPGGLYCAPQSIEAYEKDPENAVKREDEYFVSMDDVVGIVRQGTRLQCVRLDRHRGGSLLTGYDTYYTLYARILTGEHAGTIADIEDIGLSRPGDWQNNYEKGPDPLVLRLVEAKASSER